jgi:hypothetical protein
MISSSADGYLHLIKTDTKMNLKAKFSRKTGNGNSTDIPTSVDWLSSEGFVCGFI